jgi:NADPH-dependent 2,4-dienoyl-CoA reductase/sulfur reductase-like enzyme/nitrite reductase/ring-hydroxylating ferredoxin subunit
MFVSLEHEGEARRQITGWVEAQSMATRSVGLRRLNFRNGVAAKLIREGSMLAGHVEGESALLVRHDGTVYAIGAVCTYHGASLADGMVVDGEIRCPCHHACYSLETGDVTRAPALNPLPRWEVHEHGGRIFVGRKCKVRDPLTMRAVPRSKLRMVVIVGGGAAGTAAAETLRARGFKGTITIIDPDEDAPYDRPSLSKDYLAGTAPQDRLPLRPPGFHAQHGIRRMVDAAVAVDSEKRNVQLQSGAIISYDALIIATGATPLRLRIPGADLPHVRVLRTLRDCEALIRVVNQSKRIVIAGAGFIGMEAAAALRQRDKAVTLVAPEMIPLCHVLGPTIGGSLMRLHQQHGVQFKLGRSLLAINERAVLLDDRTILPADAVLLATGVTPQLDIADSAGLNIDHGVVVDEYMATSVRGVYAVGDIARYPDPRSGDRIRLGHWMVAQRQGEVAARNILGERVRLDAVPFFSTRQYDVTVSCVGHAEDYTHIQVVGSPESGSCSAWFMNGRQLHAHVSIGRERESLKVERQLEKSGALMERAKAYA